MKEKDGTAMSDVMFNEVGVLDQKQPYKYGDWKLYAVHDGKNIKGFFGEYRWLSNFHVAEVEYDGDIYPSTENAYQAAKLMKEHRNALMVCSPLESKREWKKYPPLDASPEEWDARKLKVMTYITLDKYRRHDALRERLLATGERYIEETNHWGDVYWGVDIRRGGNNHLGKLLMNVRQFFRQKAL